MQGFGMPTLIENSTLEDNIKYAHESWNIYTNVYI